MVSQDLILKMLTKDPEMRINLSKIREHPWVTKNGEEPLPPTEENVVGFINKKYGRCNYNIHVEREDLLNNVDN